MVKVYLRMAVETFIGNGTAYYEVNTDTGYAERQVEVIEGKYYSSRENFHPGIGIGLADQPFSEYDFSHAENISSDEFERLWVAAG